MLPVADRPWDSIQMDFIEQLPESSGYTAILVIIDRHSKQGIFLPTHDSINTPELVRLFVCNVFSKHGVPTDITSDRGSEFVSHFFCSVGAALNVRLHYTSGYHPQANGGAERLNQTLETYIRMYCNYQQDNWADLLPIAEFAYNNSPHESTGLTPFFVNKGYHPKMTNDPDTPYTSIAARKYTTDLAALHDVVREQITASNEIYKEYADRKRVPAPEFPDGSMAYVKAKFFLVTRPSHKLADKYLGPYKVLNHVHPLSVTLALPDALQNVHPVFHVSMLEPFPNNLIPNRIASPPPLVTINGEVEYEIKAIVDSKILRNKLKYRVEWLGYEKSDDNKRYKWMDSAEFEHSQEVINAFHNQYPKKPTLADIKPINVCTCFATISGLTAVIPTPSSSLERGGYCHKPTSVTSSHDQHTAT
jgi:hypothetical protein